MQIFPQQQPGYFRPQMEKTIRRFDLERQFIPYVCLFNLNILVDEYHKKAKKEPTQPDGLISSIKLHKYQLAAVDWMKRIERDKKNRTIFPLSLSLLSCHFPFVLNNGLQLSNIVAFFLGREMER